MPTPANRRHAALLLRWAAQLAAGENVEILSACRWALVDAGYSRDELEEWAQTFAGKALGIAERLAPRPASVPIDEERRAA